MDQHIDYDDLALLSITKAAKILKVGKPRIYQMIVNREVGVIEFNNGTVKIPKSELIKWVQERITYREKSNSPVESRKSRKSPAFNVGSVMEQIIRDDHNE